MRTRYQELVFDGGEPGSGTASATEVQDVTEREIGMLTGAFQLHLATVTPSGGPYVQYRSGPRGFVHHLGGNRFGFADLRGNRQFVTVGNLAGDPRVALFVADYPMRRRLKLFGTARVLTADEDRALFDRLHRVGDGRLAGRAEASVVIDVEAFDWNCGRSLVAQYTADEVRERIAPYRDEIEDLRSQVSDLKRRLAEVTGTSTDD